MAVTIFFFFLFFIVGFIGGMTYMASDILHRPVDWFCTLSHFLVTGKFKRLTKEEEMEYAKLLALLSNLKGLKKKDGGNSD